MNAAITLADVYAAQRRLRPHLAPTPLRHSPWLSEACRGSLWLKLESLHESGSFKIRGALNAMLRLTEASPGAHAVTASAGNHGRALAWAAERLRVPAVVFTPATAPATKRRAIERHGATLRDDAPDYDTAEQRAREYARDTGGVYISPYNHPDVIAGAGTVALELLDARPELHVVVLPLGGGGLASGVALALAAAGSHARVIGVEVEASRAFSSSVAAGRLVTVPVATSIADGLVGNVEPGSITFGLVQQHVDQIVTVGERDVQEAMRGLTREEHLIAEGAGAAATAAVLASGVVARGEVAVSLVTGCNVDESVFRQVLAAPDLA